MAGDAWAECHAEVTLGRILVRGNTETCLSLSSGRQDRSRPVHAPALSDGDVRQEPLYRSHAAFRRHGSLGQTPDQDILIRRLCQGAGYSKQVNGQRKVGMNKVSTVHRTWKSIMQDELEKFPYAKKSPLKV